MDSEPATDRREFLKSAAAASVAVGGASAGCLDLVDDEPSVVYPEVDASVTRDSEGEGVIYQYFHTPWTEIEADLDLVDDAGVDALWLPQPARGKLDFQHLATDDQEGFYEPEHPEFGGLEPHPPLGYQPVDLRDFDGALGTEAELASLIESAHDRGIEVILDAVINHVANPDPAPADLWGDSDDPLETTTLDWPQFEVEEHFTVVPSLDYRGDVEHPQFDGSLLGLPSLDVSHPEVQAAHAEYLTKIADIGADGVRFDAAKHVWPWYFEEEINPLCEDLGLWRVGEVWSEGDRWELERFAETGMNVFDFTLYRDLVDALERGDLTTISRDEGLALAHTMPEAAVTFPQNHDTAGPDVGPGSPEGELMDLANAFVLAAPGTPHLFRTEIGEDLRDERIRDLIRVKNTLARGELIERHVSEDCYAFEREGNLLAAINVADAAHTASVEVSWSEGTTLADATDHGEPVEVDGDGTVEITVPERGWVMYAVAE